jgi:hypothetical protein
VAGGSPPHSRLHLAYVALDGIKVVLLPIVGVVLVAGIAFTMHGTIMLLLYATPILFGFANYIVPLQVGAPDVAFPRLRLRSGGTAIS